MKQGHLPIAIKKQAVIILHLLFLCLSFAGITFIIFNPNYGRGLNWLQEEDYADTHSFSRQLEEDVDNVFRYVRYKDLLELDGEVNLDAEMFCVTYNSGNTKIYTLGEAVSYARRLGYYLNDDFEVAGGPDIHEWDTQGPSTPFVEWKTYSPEEAYEGPGDGFTSVEELSVQVMNVLGEYYQVRYNYIDQPSNLYFRVSYVDDMGNELLYTNAGQRSNEELRELGRYLYMSGRSLFVDNNLRYIPENVISLLSNNNRYGNQDYYILLAVDIRFPNPDPYAEAQADYMRSRTEYIGGAVMFLLGAVGLLVTLAGMALLTGHVDGDSTRIQRHYYDELPVECLFVICLAAMWLAQLALGSIIPRIIKLIISPVYQDYARKMIRYILFYLILLFAALSVLRNYKAHTLWTGSLLYKGLHRILPALNGLPIPLRFTCSFIGYLLADAGLLGGFYFLYTQRESLGIPYLYLIPLLILAAFQVWVYLLLYRSRAESQKIAGGILKMSAGDAGYKIDSEGFSEPAERVSQALNSLSDGLEAALSEQVKSERLKADLITNVSHDIKTPLTSIINYVDLLKREKISDPKIQGYLDVLDQKSQRLKTLTEDLVEASKASSGNIKLDISEIDLVELVQQAGGEFEERFAIRHLNLVSTLPDKDILIMADGRRMWRVLENLYNNAFKYAMENSRIYVEVEERNSFAYFTIKNVSASPLNINADELTERFVRGDVARTTEGSGLGLSIAKSLTQLQGGSFEIYIDGDLFKVQVGFPVRN